MNKGMKILLLAVALLPMSAFAQLSSNPYKYLGNITTSYNVDAGGGIPQFYKLWNQITCENESKWSSVEGNRGNFNWGGADRAFNYAKQHDFTYKFHALVWGAQYPGWLESLPAGERFSAMTNWFNHAKEHYDELPMIDVVNEAVGNHQAGNPMIKETLGGGGKTGYDWLIKAFEMAYERWPNAILIYNDYNSIRWDIDNYITLVRTLRDAGAPIDAYGNQSHDVNDISEDELKNALKKQQDALKMPMFITELDIDKANDEQQKAQYQKVLPAMWEAPYCAGVTLWGYVVGHTWVGNSGLYKENGEERPAMTWIKEYMATDAAKNAVGPLPGTKKEASVYIRPAALKVAVDDVLPIKVRAKMATKTIEKIDLYANDELIATMTSEPYMAEYSASTTGTKTLKAVVTTTDGSTYERYSRVTVSRGDKRKPYNDVVPELPGTIKIEEFDEGMSGVSYFNTSRNTTTTTATKDGQWMEYTVDVAQDGLYSLAVEVASTKTGGMFHLSEYGFDNLTFYTNITPVPNTGSSTEFQTLHCPMTQSLTAGRHVFCLNIDKGGFYVKSLTFNLIPSFTMPGAVAVKDMVRSEGVEVKTTSEGEVLSMDNSDWAEYLVDVSLSNNKYSYEMTASSVEGASVSMTLIDSDGSEKALGTVSISNTGSLNTYEVKTGKIRNKLNEGKQTLRLTLKSGSCNIASLNFTNSESTGINELAGNDAVATGETYNLSGQKVGAGYKGIVIRNGKKYVER